MAKPTLLFATQHLPCSSQVYGAQLRAYQIAKALQDFATVVLWVFPYAEVSNDDLERTEKEFGPTKIVPCDQKASKSPAKFVSEQLDPSCGTIGRAFPSPALRQEFLTLSDQCSLTWFHCLVIPNLFGRKIWKNSVLDIDDVPSQVWKRRSKSASGVLEKMRKTRQVTLWRQRERELTRRFSVVTTCSSDDASYLSLSPEVGKVVPNGFSTNENVRERNSQNFLRIGFIGTFNYQPNEEGVAWFIRDVWPLILAQKPDAELRLVGAGSELFTSDTLNIRGLGFVDDADSEMRSWACSIVPLLSGGGTRIKIAEAFSKGCPLVSTTLGAHGYALKDGRECFLRDGADTFAEACTELLNNPERGQTLADLGYAEFARRWSWSAIRPAILDAAATVINRSGSEAYA